MPLPSSSPTPPHPTQVHKGALLVDGAWTPVAVKVLHPNVDRYIHADAALLEVVADGLQEIGRAHV